MVRSPEISAMETAFKCCVVLLMCTLWVACFGEPDYEGRLCQSGNTCPAGFTCGEDGRCHKGAPRIDAGGGGDMDATPAADAGDSDDAASAPDAETPDSGFLDASDPIDGGGPDRARCNDAVRYPIAGWEARTFSVSANDELETCLGVEDLAGNALDRNFLSAGPIPGLNDRFGTRYTARRTFTRGVQTLTLSYDDGIRIFINGTLIFENWTRGITALDEELLSPYLDGTFDVVIEHFEHDGAARIKFDWRRGCGVIPSPASGWNIAYYRLDPMNQIDQTECLGVEYDPADQFSRDWGVQNGDGWAAVGHGRRSFFGLTRFAFDHDDGMRLTIGSTPVYDALAGGPASTEINVHATGDYDLRFELIDVAGTAHADVSWFNECDQPIAANTNSWAARYYSVIYDGSVNPPQWTLNYGDCRYVELIPTPELDFDWMGGSPTYLMSNYNLVELWGAEFSGPRVFATNTLVSLAHDDGLRVYIDGALYYDSWTAPQVVNGSFFVSGSRDVFIQYFENLGGAGLHFNY